MELQFALYGAHSLKDKRSVVKRIIGRCKNEFNIAIAEVEELDSLDRATIGVVTVGNDRRYIESVLTHIENFVEKLGVAELLEAKKIIETY